MNKKYKVNYKVNKGPVKDQLLTVIIEGTDIEDCKERFHRTSVTMANGDLNYKADIVTVSEVVSKSQMKRFVAQGVPGA